MAPFGELVGRDLARMEPLEASDKKAGLTLIYNVLRSLDQQNAEDNYHPHYFFIPMMNGMKDPEAPNGTPGSEN